MTVEGFLIRQRAAYRPGTDTPAHADVVRAGERLYLSAQGGAGPDGWVAAPGNAVAQTNAAIDRLEVALGAAGSALKDITKLTTSIVDRGHRRDVYAAISRRLPNVYPVSTGLIVAGLPAPEMVVQIDAEAISPPAGTTAVRRHRPYDLADWHGQNFSWQGSMLAAGASELFIRGQTGATLEGGNVVAVGRRPEDAAAQADLALGNPASQLHPAQPPPSAAGRRLRPRLRRQHHRLYLGSCLSHRRLSDDRQTPSWCSPGLDRHHRAGLRTA